MQGTYRVSRLCRNQRRITKRGEVNQLTTASSPGWWSQPRYWLKSVWEAFKHTIRKTPRMHDSSPSRKGAGDPLPQSHPEALRRFTSHVYKKSFPPLRKQQQTLSYWAFLKEQRESRRGGEGPQFRVTSLEDLWTKGVTKARGEKASEKGNKYIYMICFFKLACLAWLVGWAQINLFAKLPYSWIWEFLLFYMLCLQQRIHSYDEFSFPLM